MRLPQNWSALKYSDGLQSDGSEAGPWVNRQTRPDQSSMTSCDRTRQSQRPMADLRWRRSSKVALWHDHQHATYLTEAAVTSTADPLRSCCWASMMVGFLGSHLTRVPRGPLYRGQGDATMGMRMRMRMRRELGAARCRCHDSRPVLGRASHQHTYRYDQRDCRWDMSTGTSSRGSACRGDAERVMALLDAHLSRA